MPRIEVVGEICLRRPRPTQSWRAEEEEDNDDDDDDDGYLRIIIIIIIIKLNGQIMTPKYKDSLLNTARLIVDFFSIRFLW
jgi:hypothetical protein